VGGPPSRGKGEGMVVSAQHFYGGERKKTVDEGGEKKRGGEDYRPGPMVPKKELLPFDVKKKREGGGASLSAGRGRHLLDSLRPGEVRRGKRNSRPLL